MTTREVVKKLIDTSDYWTSYYQGQASISWKITAVLISPQECVEFVYKNRDSYLKQTESIAKMRARHLEWNLLDYLRLEQLVALVSDPRFFSFFKSTLEINKMLETLLTKLTRPLNAIGSDTIQIRDAHFYQGIYLNLLSKTDNTWFSPQEFKDTNYRMLSLLASDNSVHAKTYEAYGAFAVALHKYYYAYAELYNSIPLEQQKTISLSNSASSNY